MSDNVNTEWLERRAETLSLAYDHMDLWAGTLWESKIDMQVKRVENADLEDMPSELISLDTMLIKSSQAAFDTFYDPISVELEVS